MRKKMRDVDDRIDENVIFFCVEVGVFIDENVNFGEKN